MALKKSNLYSSLWASCDELRGGMDASQYKDYVLFMLFIKYISDKYGNSRDFTSPVVIPKGASFTDMVALKGKSDIGDKINTQIIQPLIDDNTRLARSDFPDFNDPNKLGEGQAMVDRLTNLIGIFQKPELDFSQNRAEHDDILGDAYEYLMRHFATESGKSKGQFYTPAEVSRVIAQVIGISPQNTKAATTAYDPTCGSGSLLLKVAAQAGKHITLEGQEKDVTTAGLARMNMILHDFPTANILSGSSRRSWACSSRSCRACLARFRTPSSQGGVRDEASPADAVAAITEEAGQVGGFDLDAVVEGDHTIPPRRPARLDLADLNRLLNEPAMLPPGVSVDASGPATSPTWHLA